MRAAVYRQQTAKTLSPLTRNIPGKNRKFFPSRVLLRDCGVDPSSRQKQAYNVWMAKGDGQKGNANAKIAKAHAAAAPNAAAYTQHNVFAEWHIVVLRYLR